jgi:hypothetical protein
MAQSQRNITAQEIEGQAVSRNYILAAHGTYGTQGWATYADAAASSPVDGTGGSPTLTFTQSTSSPLRGNASFLITTTAADLQGQGAGYAFTIDSADQAKILSISFDYAFDVTQATGDFSVWIYDVTNALLIPPTGYQVQGGVSGTNYKHIATFQTASNSTSYRLIIHRAVTTATAVNFKIDNVVVGPQIVQYGAPITDWQSYTPTFGSGFGTATNVDFKSRRVGDTLEIIGKFNAGTVAGSAATFTMGYGGINANVTFDSSKAQVGTAAGSVVTNASPSTTYFTPTVLTPSANGSSVMQFGVQTSTAAGITAANGNVAFTTGCAVGVHCIVPITGWSSTVQMSNDTDTRVVSSRMGATSNITGINPNNSAVKLNLSNSTTAPNFDKTASCSSGTFTCPVTGLYWIAPNIIVSSTNVLNNTYQARIYKNGVYTAVTSQAIPAATTQFILNGGTLLNLNAGDTVEVYLFGSGNNSVSTLTVYGDSTDGSHCSINRLSGPSAIAASELVAASYQTNAGTSVPNTGDNIVDFEDKVFDTHGAVTTGASWKFTAPIAGKYRVSANILFSSLATTAGNAIDLQLWKNGAVQQRLHYKSIEAALTTFVGISGTGLISLNAGDYIDVRVSYNRTGGATTLHNSATYNTINIERVGF